MIIFTAEFLLKAIAYGMYTTDNIELQLQTPPKLKALTLGDIGPPPLLHDSWAYIDMTVLLVSYISYFLAHVLAQIGADGALKIIRLLRAIRPLRIVNRSPGMRVVILALQKSGPGVANVLLLIFFTFLIFAIVATDICGGYFFACTDGTRVGYTDCMRVHKNANGVVAPRVWRNPHIHAEGAAGLAPSFDNVGRGFLLLFELATLDDWEGTLFQMMDVRDTRNLQPVLDTRMYSGMFLVLFVFCGALFMMQLFISVVIDAYCDTDGSSWLTEQQQLFCDLMQLVSMLHPIPKPEQPEPEDMGGVRRVCYNLFIDPYPQRLPSLEWYKVDHKRPNTAWPAQLSDSQVLYSHLAEELNNTVSSLKKQALEEQIGTASKRLEKAKRDRDLMAACAQDKLESVQQQNTAQGRSGVRSASLGKRAVYFIGFHFDAFITGCIFVSVVLMMMTWRTQPQFWTDLLPLLNLPLVGIFMTEMLIKNTGLGPSTYWTNPMDAFDGVVTLMAFFDAVGALGNGSNTALVFRIGRVFRLLKKFPQLKAMVVTLVTSIPAISNVFGVLFMIFFIYAVIGVNLFGETRLGVSMSQDANMRDWQSAMSTLWRCMTGNWRSIMYEQSTQPPSCTNIVDEKGAVTHSDCGSPAAAVIFHVTFQIATMFAVLTYILISLHPYLHISLHPYIRISITLPRCSIWSLPSSSTPSPGSISSSPVLLPALSIYRSLSATCFPRISRMP